MKLSEHLLRNYNEAWSKQVAAANRKKAETISKDRRIVVLKT